MISKNRYYWVNFWIILFDIINKVIICVLNRIHNYFSHEKFKWKIKAFRLLNWDYWINNNIIHKLFCCNENKLQIKWWEPRKKPQTCFELKIIRINVFFKTKLCCSNYYRLLQVDSRIKFFSLNTRGNVCYRSFGNVWANETTWCCEWVIVNRGARVQSWTALLNVNHSNGNTARHQPSTYKAAITLISEILLLHLPTTTTNIPSCHNWKYTLSTWLMPHPSGQYYCLLIKWPLYNFWKPIFIRLLWNPI